MTAIQKKAILDEIEWVMESLRSNIPAGGLASPACGRLAGIARIVRSVDPEDEGDPDDDHLEALAGKLKACEAEPTLDAVLRAARQHCYTVTFTFCADD